MQTAGNAMSNAQCLLSQYVKLILHSCPLHVLHNETPSGIGKGLYKDAVQTWACACDDRLVSGDLLQRCCV